MISIRCSHLIFLRLLLMVPSITIQSDIQFIIISFYFWVQRVCYCWVLLEGTLDGILDNCAFLYTLADAQIWFRDPWNNFSECAKFPICGSCLNATHIVLAVYHFPRYRQVDNWCLSFDSSLTVVIELLCYLFGDSSLFKVNQAASTDFKGSRLLYGSFGSGPVPLKLCPLEALLWRSLGQRFMMTFFMILL